MCTTSRVLTTGCQKTISHLQSIQRSKLSRRVGSDTFSRVYLSKPISAILSQCQNDHSIFDTEVRSSIISEGLAIFIFRMWLLYMISQEMAGPYLAKFWRHSSTWALMTNFQWKWFQFRQRLYDRLRKYSFMTECILNFTLTVISCASSSRNRIRMRSLTDSRLVSQWIDVFILMQLIRSQAMRKL